MFRFGLGTLLLLVTFFCVWLAFQVNRARVTKRVIDAVEESGGEVFFVHQKTGPDGIDPSLELRRPAWLRKLVGDEFFLEVTYIRFTSRITDSDLSRLCPILKRLPDLPELALDHAENLSDIGPLRELHNVHRLYVHHGVNITDVRALARLTNLQTLGLYRCTKLTDIAVLKELSSLKELRLYECENLSDISVLGGLASLQILELNRCPISDIRVLKGLTNLQQLYLHETRVSGADAEDLQNALPNCRLDVRNP